MNLLLTMAALAVSFQSGSSTPFNSPADGAGGAVTPLAASDPTPATAEDLRVRIREMRMNLLLGGDQVRRAESEAIEFYKGKSRSLDGRLDDVASELAELRASYDVSLDRALAQSGTAAGDQALQEAQPLRAQISSLEAEREDLLQRQERVSVLVDAVESRDRERSRLADQVESATLRPEDLGVPMGSIGLAPPPLPSESVAPLENEALLGDLLERDPRAARRLLFRSDSLGYWQRFPLQPPRSVLASAMRFPLPDPPGQR
jgi:prefoldin subunit 5